MQTTLGLMYVNNLEKLVNNIKITTNYVLKWSNSNKFSLNSNKTEKVEMSFTNKFYLNF